MATAERDRAVAADRRAGATAVVSDLRKRYRPAAPEAVAGISFDIAAGEVFGLLGPNGAGKTTTIGVMTTRVRPSGGRVLIDDFDVVRDAVAVKQRIAVVPQRPNLDRAISAIENLTFHGAYFGWSRRARRMRALELLEQFGLEGRGDDRVNDYSGGMAQRLMIARALMHEPRLLFLDEPTTGLDPQARLFLWDRIEELRDSGVTVLLTTHDMAEADRLCGRIAIIDHGQVIALDTPHGLRALLPDARGVELTVDGDPATAFAALRDAEISALADGRWLVRAYGDITVAQAIELADAGGLKVVDLRRIDGTLEDVFVHLTGKDLR
jgi:ABC-2 type transport system ATP-binding protein